MSLYRHLEGLSDPQKLQELLIKVIVGVLIAVLIHFLQSSSARTTQRVTKYQPRERKETSSKENEQSSTLAVNGSTTLPLKAPSSTIEQHPDKLLEEESPPVLEEDQANQTKEKKQTKKESSTRIRQPPASSTPANSKDRSPPPFISTNDDFADLKGFHYWMDTEASLFRLYVLCREDGTDEVPPYNPLSLRGKTSVKVEVTNRFSRKIKVYWVNYKGKEEEKGSVNPMSTWHQQTWIDHPWVFRDAETGRALLHYIPYRVIPTTDAMPTVDLSDREMGLHRFSITRPTDENYLCGVSDPVFPFPANEFMIKPSECVQWACLHCHRMNYGEWDTLIKYLFKIVQQPSNTKYRQIRQANPVFGGKVWNTTARGILFAAGFVENEGYAEIGTSSTLSRSQVQELSWLLMYLERWKSFAGAPSEQPEGADGFGRASYNRVGLR